MKHVRFGVSGLRVSELCLGAITFGDPRSFGSSPEESRAIFDGFASAGGSFIDTANMYGEGASERLLGEFIRSDRDSFVISTKYTPSRSGGVQRSGNGRKNMMRSIEESLRRLATDHVDVFWLHARDGVTPWEEIMRGLDDLVASGKVLYVGASDTPAWEISRANLLAELRGWSRFVGIQVEYSLVERTAERELLPMAHALGLGITAWSPLAGGALSGKYSSESPAEPTRLRREGINRRTLDIADTLALVARDVGASSAQVALSWLSGRDQGGPTIPIVGARTRAQLDENLASLNVTLDSSQRARLDDATRIDAGFPHQFLASDMLKRFLAGGDPSLLR
ncbi:MAG TPA: aldo/keto reductase [Polyangiaceae bacterium]|nr:aldo/keto reductase [Polyangiaceae bacterium]